MSDTKPHTALSTVHWLLTIAGAAGIVGLFLPFAFNTSPIEAALDDVLWDFAVPAFLAVLASAASVRWIVSGALSAAERKIAYVVSVSMAFLTSWLILTFFLMFIDDGESFDAHALLSFLGPLAILALGVVALVRNSRIGMQKEFIPVMAIQVAYLANAMWCLVMFSGDWNLGAWFVLTAMLAYALQIILVSMQAGRRARDRAS